MYYQGYYYYSILVPGGTDLCSNFISENIKLISENPNCISEFSIVGILEKLT